MLANGEQEECEPGSASLRPVVCELGVLSRPHGSALLTQGSTAVMAAVYGPMEVRMQRLLVDQASVEAVFRPRAGVPGTVDRLRESVIRSTCEAAMRAALYPRTSVTVVVQEMQDSGGLLACALNSACLALVNSGVAMRFLFAAVSCALLEDGSLVLDPPASTDSRGHVTVAFDSLSRNVVASHTSGNFPRQRYMEALARCRQAAAFLFDLYRDIVRKYAAAL